MKASHVHSYGFKKHSSSFLVTGLVRQILYLADVWNMPVVISCQDVKTAFDAMRHDVIHTALHRRGLSSHIIAVMMRELSGLKAVVSLPTAGTTEPFNYDRGGKQGGVETPDQWSCLLDYVMEPLVVQWADRKWGFVLKTSEEDARYITHAVFADNIVLFAASRQILQQMVDELTTAMYNLGLEWKSSSLETLAGGQLRGGPLELYARVSHDCILTYKEGSKLFLLGDEFDAAGSTEVSFMHRLGIGDITYFKH